MLVKIGRSLGPKIKELITIVSPRTFARWLNRERRGRAIPLKRIGRPRVLADTELLNGSTRPFSKGLLKPFATLSISPTTNKQPGRHSPPSSPTEAVVNPNIYSFTHDEPGRLGWRPNHSSIKSALTC